MISLATPLPINAPAPPASLEHRRLRDGAFWQAIPRYAEIDEATFLDHVWQGRQFGQDAGGAVRDDRRDRRRTVHRRCARGLRACADGGARLAVPDRRRSTGRTPTTTRSGVSSSRSSRPRATDHPRLTLDSLHEQQDSPVPGLIHRYADKALFLPLQTCPVYCRFCTRSYAIGPDTAGVDKLALGNTADALAPGVRLHRRATRRSKTS